MPTVDGRSEVGCKSWKCDSSNPGQCYTSRASSSKIVVCVSVKIFLKPRAETSFCLKEERSATAAPSPPPPCSKRTPTRFHRRLVGTLSRALLRTPPSLAKQVAKIATRGRSPPRCFCCCLVWEKVWRYLGMVGILPSQLYLDAATPSTLSRAYFPCCPRLPATEHHHPVSSTRRLSVKHKHPLSWCTNDYIWVVLYFNEGKHVFIEIPPLIL